MRKVMLITGGSRGIGAAVARMASQSGYDVAVNYTSNSSAAQAVVDEINQNGGNAISIKADVSDETAVNDMFDALDTTMGRLDVLVNNAGILFETASVAAISRERLDRVIAVNVIGSVLCAQQACKRMAKDNGGSGGAIVNVSSIAAKLGSPDEYVDYALSKGAIDTFTTGLAKEVANQGIRVNAVRPGLIHTEIHASGGNPDRVEKLSSAVPMSRGGDPDEVAAAILWLASDQASYCTGAFIDVAGGRA